MNSLLSLIGNPFKLQLLYHYLYYIYWKMEYIIHNIINVIFDSVQLLRGWNINLGMVLSYLHQKYLFCLWYDALSGSSILLHTVWIFSPFPTKYTPVGIRIHSRFLQPISHLAELYFHTNIYIHFLILRTISMIVSLLLAAIYDNFVTWTESLQQY